MVIAHLEGGLGNQVNQYWVARFLALKLNTELKLDVSFVLPNNKNRPRSIGRYRLGAFNILENFATPEEINNIKEKGIIPKSLAELKNLSEIEDFQDDVFITGHWMHGQDFFGDFIEIARKEFTLKNPLSPNAEEWRQKILSAECSVLMHFRHGDFAYNPGQILKADANSYSTVIPLYYYHTCLNILRQRYSNLTVFVFSDDLPWLKKNLHLDVPVEFVEGCATDDEEFILMCLCQHDIIPYSTFSLIASYLNPNRDKKVFSPKSSSKEIFQQYINDLSSEKKDSLLNSGTKIIVPFDGSDKQIEDKLFPLFSFLLVVNNDVATIAETLDGLFNQDYKYYEVIIIDNASTDGSEKICQQAIEGKKRIIYKRLREKISNAGAWNKAFKMAQGSYVSFIKGNDRFIYNMLSKIYYGNVGLMTEIIAWFTWLEENENGDISFAGKKFSEQIDTEFKKTRWGMTRTDGHNAVKLLMTGEINHFLGTKLFERDYLSKNGIIFDEKLADDEAELFFQIEAFFKSRYFRYNPNSFYIAP